MSDTSRRDLLTGAAGLAAGGVLALPAPAMAHPEPAAEPFRIEPSANYIEFKRLARIVAEMDRGSGIAGTPITHDQPYVWLRSLLHEMTARPPRSASDQLDYAA